MTKNDVSDECWCEQCQRSLLKGMVTALKERFSYFTDPFSAQWFTSITHHSEVKTHFLLKENWISLITYSPIFLFCVWHVNNLIQSALCNLYALNPRLYYSFVRICGAIQLPFCTKVALFNFSLSEKYCLLLFKSVLIKSMHFKVFTKKWALHLAQNVKDYMP